MPAEVTAADINDLEALMTLEYRCFARRVAFSRRQWRYLLRSPRASVAVIRHGDYIAGVAVLLLRQTQRGALGRFYTLAVDPRYRGKGMARTLLTHFIQFLKNEKAYKVSLEVEVDNAPAIGLYESIGFKRLARLKDYYAPGQDGLKMELALAG